MNDQALIFASPLDTCIEENPILVEYMMFRFRPEYIKELEPYIVKDWIIPDGSHKGMRLTEVEPMILKYLADFCEFKYRYPMIHYSIRYLIKHKRLLD